MLVGANLGPTGGRPLVGGQSGPVQGSGTHLILLLLYPFTCTCAHKDQFHQFTYLPIQIQLRAAHATEEHKGKKEVLGPGD